MNTFTCYLCGETYEKAWTDADARAEMVDRYGPDTLDVEFGVICDDCDERVTAWWKGLPADVRSSYEQQMKAEAATARASRQ